MALTACASTAGGGEPAADISPPPTTHPPTTLAVIADFGNCGPGEERVARMVDTWGSAAVATAGDNAYVAEGCTPFSGSVGDYYGQYVNDPAGPRFWPSLGNHDYENADAGLAAYRRYFSYLDTDADAEQRWYDTTVDEVTLFMLDSQAPEADVPAQQVWLEGALTRSRAQSRRGWNIVVHHAPAFTSGSHPPDTAFRPEAGWDYRGWGADLVVAGHQHIYEDVVVDGLHYVTAGIATNGLDRGGCAKELTAGSRVCLEGEGALRVVATPEVLEVQYRQPAAGGDLVLDSFTIAR